MVFILHFSFPSQLVAALLLLVTPKLNFSANFVVLEFFHDVTVKDYTKGWDENVN